MSDINPTCPTCREPLLLETIADDEVSICCVECNFQLRGWDKARVRESLVFLQNPRHLAV